MTRASTTTPLGSTCSYSCYSYSESSRDGATTKMSNPHVPERGETDRALARLRGMTIYQRVELWYVRGPLRADCANPVTLASKAGARKVRDRLDREFGAAKHEIVRVARSIAIEVGGS